MSNQTDDSASSGPADPSQVTAPDVDTSTPIWRWITFENAPFLIPTILGFVGGVISIGFVGLIGAGFLFTLTMFWTAAVYILVKQTSSYTKPSWKFRDAVAFNRMRLAMPWYHSEMAASSIHQVEEIYADGTVETTTEELVGAVRVDGANTADMTDEERDRMVGELATAVDERIENFYFKMYSTTEEFDADRVVGQYDDAAGSKRLDRAGMEYARELLNSVYAWFKGADAPTWQASEFRHYIVVKATAEECRETYADLEESADDQEEIDGLAAETRQEMHETLHDRMSIVRNSAAPSVEGCSARYVGAAEITQLLQRYWGGQTPVGSLRDAEEMDAEGETPAPGDDRVMTWADAEQFLEAETVDELEDGDDAHGAPSGGIRGRPHSEIVGASHFDVKRRNIEIGDQYARTYWVAQWPPKPKSMLLRKLYNLCEGVDLDVAIHNHPLDRDRVKDALRYDIRDLNVEEADRGTDISSLDVSENKKSYIRLYQQLRAEVTQPWAINGYITVRAGDLATLDGLDDELETSRGFNVLKRRHLEAGAEAVRKAVEGSPANLTLVAPGLRQKEAFVSASPIGSDRYNEVNDGSDWMHGIRQIFGGEHTGDVIEGNRATLAGGGAVAATFPFCSAVIQDPDGTLWGRNMQNGSPINVDPLDRGSSGHTLTIGKTRHGKTYFAMLALSRWYLERGDRTLIVADTQGGFDGFTQYCDGEHIVIDGSNPINPLYISPPDEKYTVGEGEADPVRIKIEEVTQFVVGVLESQGVENAGEYADKVGDIATRTYKNAGIEAGDIDSLAKPSPTMQDFLDEASDMVNEAKKYTHSGHEAETSIKQQRVAELLDYLSGFREDGKYHALMGSPGDDGEAMHDAMGLGLDDPEVDMVYLDLEQTSVDKSVMLPLVLGQVSQAIRKAPGESAFMADEAHALLHNERAVDWIQKAAREYARYEAFLWLISQHPSEFLATGSSDDKEVFKDQCSIKQFFRTPGVDTETLKRFGMNEIQAERVRNGLEPGRSDTEDGANVGIGATDGEDAGEDKGYSECLIELQDREGWIPMRVESSEFEHTLLRYKPSKHGEFRQYVADETGLEKFEQLAEEHAEGLEADAKEERIAELEAALEEARSSEAGPPTPALADGGALTIEERAANRVRELETQGENL